MEKSHQTQHSGEGEHALQGGPHSRQALVKPAFFPLVLRISLVLSGRRRNITLAMGSR
jgi:hypothetical protein